VGVVLVHHTNKPATNVNEKATWSAGDYAYLGAGSAEWCNWARAVVALRSIGSDTVFELRAAKRGGRLHWRDENGEPTYVRYVAHSDTGIHWREATTDQVDAVLAKAPGKVGRPKEKQPSELVEAAVQHVTPAPLPVSVLQAWLQEEHRIGRNKAQEAVKLAQEQGWLSRASAPWNGSRCDLIGLPGAAQHEAARLKAEADATKAGSAPANGTSALAVEA